MVLLHTPKVCHISITGVFDLMALNMCCDAWYIYALHLDNFHQVGVGQLIRS